MTKIIIKKGINGHRVVSVKNGTERKVSFGNGFNLSLDARKGTYTKESPLFKGLLTMLESFTEVSGSELQKKTIAKIN